MTPLEVIQARASAAVRREEARRAYLARTFWVKIRDPRYGPVDVESEAEDREAAVAKVLRRYPAVEVLEVSDRAHHSSYCDDPRYAEEHASWLR